MPSLTISRDYTFEAAHQLPHHKGKCARLHGHSYKLQVTITGSIINEGSSKGMIMDFADLTEIVEREIIKPWDHQFLNDLVAFDTTAENLALEIFDRLNKSGLNLMEVKLWETSKACATVTK